jgi:hypothetical protein
MRTTDRTTPLRVSLHLLPMPQGWERIPPGEPMQGWYRRTNRRGRALPPGSTAPFPLPRLTSR